VLKKSMMSVTGCGKLCNKLMSGHDFCQLVTVQYMMSLVI